MPNLSILDGCRVGILPGFQTPDRVGRPGATTVVVVPKPTISRPKPPFEPAGDPPFLPAPPPDPIPSVTSVPVARFPAVTSVPSQTGQAGFRCQESRFICVEDLEKPLSIQRVRSFSKNCVPYNPNDPNDITGVIASGISPLPGGNSEGYVIIGGSLFSNKQQCEQQCVPKNGSFSVTCNSNNSTGVVIPPGRLPELSQAPNANQNEPVVQIQDVIAIANKKQEVQLSNNSITINVNQAINPQVSNNIASNVFTNLIYDPKTTFFNVTPSEQITPVSNNLSRLVFKPTVASEIGELLIYQFNKSKTWNEFAIQNITDSKISFSLREDLLEAFNNLRDINGNLIGLPVFLEIIRSHLLVGTIEEFNPSYFLGAYERQKSAKFLTFEKSESRYSNELFSVLYLQNSEYSLATGRFETVEGTQLGRFRFLNEDLSVSIPVQKSDGSLVDFPVPNEGVSATLLTPKDASTPISVGSPSLLNIGDGGYYYFNAIASDGKGKPLFTKNLTEDSYYAPAQVKAALLDILDYKFEYTITAKSNPNSHEFVSGDTGTSSLDPLYFALNLSSVSSYDYSGASLTNYSAAYSVLTDADQIQTHINNNALAVPEFYIDYRDPLYRYIKDTSSFEMKSSDITLESLENKPTLLQRANFPKNIPFGFVIIPSRGSDFNPYNVKSTITELTDTVERELVVGPTLNGRIDDTVRSGFETYNLLNSDGKERVGQAETAYVHNFGYRYTPSNYDKSFYSGGKIESAPEPVSSYGASYLVKDVLDFIYDEHNPSSILWFDVFSRMPLSSVGQLFYDLPTSIFSRLENGYRHNITIKNSSNSIFNKPNPLPSDSKTIVKSSDRSEFNRIPS